MNRIFLISSLIAFGYVVAVAVASLVAVLAMFGLALVLGGNSGTSVLEFVSSGFVVGVFWTFICAWPGFVAVLIIAARRRWRGWMVYAAAGTANVVPSMLVFGGLAGSPFEFPGMVLSCFPGGFAGGAAYWLAGGIWIARSREERFA